MQWLRKKRVWIIVVVVIFAPLIINILGSFNQEERTTTTVLRGDVSKAIAVSGFLEADQLVELTFPRNGRVSALLVEEGDEVVAGDLLATLGNGSLAAERERAIAQLNEAEASRDELLNGLTLEARAVSSSTVAQARSALETTRESEARKVARAYTDLLASDLEARALDAEDSIPPPTISGSYQCTEEGVYTFDIYPSQSESGFSIRYQGLEQGTAPISTTQPVVIGSCGIELNFDSFELYNRSQWEIAIPNTLSETYIQRVRSYELTEEQAAQNIAAAEYALRLAEDTAAADTAEPRVEAIIQANAAVQAAQANVARVTAQLADEALYAPFSGIVTNISTNVGEVVSGPVLSLVANDAFTLVARVPEIDIRDLRTGQPATVSFDASPEETLPATITYVSPVATEIDGVSYFETNLEFAENPQWFRDGLNADIDIVIDKQSDVLRVPNRFVIDTPDGPVVRVLDNDDVATTSVVLTMRGSDGFAAITGISEGTTLVAP